MHVAYKTLIQRLDESVPEPSIIQALLEAAAAWKQDRSSDANHEHEELRALVTSLSAWVGAQGDACVFTPTGELEGWVEPSFALLSCLLGLDPAVDTVAAQNGILVPTIALLAADAGGSVTALQQCIDVVATLCLAETADKILKHLDAVPIVLGLLQRHSANLLLQEELITALALMAKRTRLRQVLAQCDAVAIVVHSLKYQPDYLLLYTAVCRFVRAFAVDAEQCNALLDSGGIDILLTTFKDAMMMDSAAMLSRSVSRADVGADVVASVWTCTTESQRVQRHLADRGFLPALAACLHAESEREGLHEAGLGIVRNMSRTPAFREAITQAGFISIAVGSMRAASSRRVGEVREACGFIGNLACEAHVRLQLAFSGAAPAIVDGLLKCREDKKVAKLALAALVNLTNCEKNRSALAADGRVATLLLDTARLYIGSESLLELAVGAMSHFSVNEDGAAQMLEAGAVDALLVFLMDGVASVPVVSKSMMALRRLYHCPSTSCMNSVSLVLQRLSEASGEDGVPQGILIIVNAMQTHDYDRSVVKETAQLMDLLSKREANVPILLKVAVRPLLRAMEIHRNDAALCDLIANLLANLPLEAEEGWDRNKDDHPSLVGTATSALVPAMSGA